MKYDFDKKWDRIGKDSSKWDKPTADHGTTDIVPMWVADMDFATAPSVIDALKERIEHPIFGYFILSDRYFNAIINWHKTRFGNDTLKKEYIAYQNSVLGGVASCISAFTQPGDQILCNATTYTGFTNTVKGLGRQLCLSELVQDKDGIFRLDLEDMEKKIVENKIGLYIFCSPHNPTGRVWDKEEIEAVVDLCYKHKVILLADEIWADFTPSGKKHIPTVTVSDKAKEITMAMYAPSKTFNLAGLVGSYSVIYNEYIRNRVAKVASMPHYNQNNVLSCTALIGAYEGGAEWVDELNAYIRGNQEYVYNYITEHFKGVKTYIPEGTYLMWLDCSGCGMDIQEVLDRMNACGVIVNDGRTFNGKTHIRMNLACPRSQCEEAMRRFDQYVFNK